MKEVIFLLEIGEKIKKLREEKGLTQKACAYSIGCSERFLIAIETNQTDPSIKLLGRMVKLFNCSFGDILD